jgi:hypothetical protein
MSDATDIYRELLAREMRGPSDTESAMHRLQVRYGLDYGWQWSWRFRPPKFTKPEAFNKLRNAYLNMIETSVRRDIARLEIEQAKGASDALDQDLLIEAKNLLERISQKRKSA